MSAGPSAGIVHPNETASSAGQVPGHATRDGLRNSNNVVQPRPAQDQFRSGHGGPVPGNDVATRDGIAQSDDPHFFRHDAMRILLASTSGRSLQ